MVSLSLSFIIRAIMLLARSASPSSAARMAAENSGVRFRLVRVHRYCLCLVILRFPLPGWEERGLSRIDVADEDLAQSSAGWLAKGSPPGDARRPSGRQGGSVKREGAEVAHLHAWKFSLRVRERVGDIAQVVDLRQTEVVPDSVDIRPAAATDRRATPRPGVAHRCRRALGCWWFVADRH